MTRWHCSSGYCSSGYCSSRYCSSGYCSSGYCSSGYCSSDIPRPAYLSWQTYMTRSGTVHPDHPNTVHPHTGHQACLGTVHPTSGTLQHPASPSQASTPGCSKSSRLHRHIQISVPTASEDKSEGQCDEDKDRVTWLQ